MKRRRNLDSIPMDLIMEIFSRLPTNSIGRFRCVSKRWKSMLTCPYFTELFLTMSCTRPRLFFALQGDHEWSFFSCPQSKSPYEKSYANFHMKFSKDMYQIFRGLTSGLMYFSDMKISEDALPVILNPRTTQYATLPKLERDFYPRSFLGFDPIGKQFKVLLIGYDDYRILTLETGKMRWRKSHCLSYYYPFGEGVCINGVLYYLAKNFHLRSKVIACFDIRSEKFKFIDGTSFDLYTYKFMNFKGKLGLIKWKYDRKGKTLELCIFVLEDVEKEEWSNYVYTLSDDKHFVGLNVSVVGMTSTGDIVLSMELISKPFYVFYFNPERYTLQSVEIKGFDEVINHRVQAFVDYVEDLNVYDVKILKSSPCLSNILTRRTKPQQTRRSSRPRVKRV